MSKKELKIKQPSWWDEFKTFAIKGNAMALAVGTIIGGAFSTITKSLTDDIIMPIINIFMGGADFTQARIALPRMPWVEPVYETVVDETGKEVVNFLNLSSSAVLLLFAFVMSALNLIWKAELSGAVKVLIHFIGSFATYAVLFIIIPGVYGNMAQIVVRGGLFAAAYFIVAFAVLIVSTVKRNRKADREEYENKF